MNRFLSKDEFSTEDGGEPFKVRVYTTGDVDCNAMFPVHPDRDAILGVRRAESEEYLAKMDAETQATIAAEIAGGTTVAKENGRTVK